MRAQIFTALIFAAVLRAAAGATKKERCYSCASENMRENFLTRERGPPNRRAEPRMYDNLCDLDSWMIRDKCTEECDGPCFKWQQILNNSGVLSYSTIRGCHSKMFGVKVDPFASFDGSAGDGAQVAATPRQVQRVQNALSDCHTTTTQLICIDQSQLEENLCYCQGNFCNATVRLTVMFGWASIVSIMTVASAVWRFV